MELLVKATDKMLDRTFQRLKDHKELVFSKFKNQIYSKIKKFPDIKLTINKVKENKNLNHQNKKRN